MLYRQFYTHTGIYSRRGRDARACSPICYAFRRNLIIWEQSHVTLGNSLGRPGPAVTPPPPASPPPTAGSAPVAADRRRGRHGIGRGGDSVVRASQAASPRRGAGRDGCSGGGRRCPGGRRPRHAGDRTGHPARLHPARRAPTAEGARRLCPENQRKWRVADVVAAISGGPRAQLLIEAASRPGPVAARQPARGGQGASAGADACRGHADGLTVGSGPRARARALTLS